MNLSEEEIEKRLARLRNLEMLHAKAKERIVFLETENKNLKARIKELEEKDNDKNAKIEALAFQLEQIKIKVFGKKPDKERIALKREREERDTASYQRPIPEKVTETKTHVISACAHCNRPLAEKSTRVSFEEGRILLNSAPRCRSSLRQNSTEFCTSVP